MNEILLMTFGVLITFVGPLIYEVCRGKIIDARQEGWESGYREGRSAGERAVETDYRENHR